MGGVERVLLGCAAGVQGRGYFPVIACPDGGALAVAVQEAELAYQPIAIDRTKATLSPARLLRQLGAWRRGSDEVLQIARRLRPGVIHVHHPVGGLYAMAAARELGIPLLLHVHEVLPLRPLYYAAARRVVPFCSAIVCVSEASAVLMRRIGVPHGRLQIIYNAVNPGFLEAVAPAEELSATRPNIGLFGVIEPRKGQAHFIRAAALLRERFPTAHFWIVGGLSFAEHAGYERQLREAAAAAGLQDRVHFTGHRSDVARWMAGMDVVTMASTRFESLPTAVIEAAVLGRPIVATDVGGVREILQHGETGLIVPPAAPVQMADAIARLLSPEGRDFGRRARADARRRFAPARFIEEMVAVYEALSRQPAELECAA
jgi:glycosyltransferase involved in cell wall biosynthesis